MTEDRKQQDKALDGLITDLQVFLLLSFQQDEISIGDWVKETVNKLESKCWEIKNCNEINCPAYKNQCGRCWLIAGTMCGGETQGKFALKYGFCTNCEVYQNIIKKDRVLRLRELIIALIHSLRSKHFELKEALSQVKTLSGFLPICSICKKIRDDKGYWSRIEEYIEKHSEAEFSHSLCKECAIKHYPDTEIYPKE